MSSQNGPRLDSIRKSLYDPWGLRDIKEIENPRVAFVALASWIDQMSRLSTGRKRRGEGAWRHFAFRLQIVETISPGRWDATNNMAKMICNHCRTVYETDATATHCSCGGELVALPAGSWRPSLPRRARRHRRVYRRLREHTRSPRPDPSREI
jgi:hypothetical protein